MAEKPVDPDETFEAPLPSGEAHFSGPPVDLNEPVSAELAEIRALRRTDPRKYDSPEIQARELTLIGQQASAPKRTSRAVSQNVR